MSSECAPVLPLEALRATIDAALEVQREDCIRCEAPPLEQLLEELTGAGASLPARAGSAPGVGPTEAGLPWSDEPACSPTHR